jgi:mono/diheme cytochrome c family protein
VPDISDDARSGLGAWSMDDIVAVHRDVCSACYAPHGKGIPRLLPSLADASSVRSRDASSILRIILRRACSVATTKKPTAPAMPAFGWQLDDTQVAALASYIRNSWGASAPMISGSDVGRARAALADRSD